MITVRHRGKNKRKQITGMYLKVNTCLTKSKIEQDNQKKNFFDKNWRLKFPDLPFIKSTTLFNVSVLENISNTSTTCIDLFE